MLGLMMRVLLGLVMVICITSLASYAMAETPVPQALHGALNAMGPQAAHIVLPIGLKGLSRDVNNGQAARGGPDGLLSRRVIRETRCVVSDCTAPRPARDARPHHVPARNGPTRRSRRDSSGGHVARASVRRSTNARRFRRRCSCEMLCG